MNAPLFKAKKSIEGILKDLRTKPAPFWEKRGQKNAFDLFRFVAKDVPAYKQLLDENNINPQEIKGVQDFHRLPVIDKESYLKKYPYLDLFPNRNLLEITTVSATSGTTGESFYIPRNEAQDFQYEYIAEIFLRNQFEIDKKSTLGIIGFGLGIWIGGIFTYKVLNKIAVKGYKLSLIPVGPNKELFLKSFKKFAPFYAQIILMGYPPFIKDIIDEASSSGIDWKNYSIKILTATETFSEEFRDYIAQRGAIKNIYEDIVNIYGTVELGTMAHETALSTLIRKIAVKTPEVFKAVFSKANRLPTLAQYHPYIIFFEEVSGELIASGYGSSIPLIRYRFPDRGDVIPFDSMRERLQGVGVDMMDEAKKIGIESTILKLPFVYVYERSDFAATLFGINIYPEYIRSALQKPDVKEKVTGKFSMMTKTDERQNQYLEVNVELQKNILPEQTLNSTTQKRIVELLIERCTEYNHLYSSSAPEYKERLKPKIIFWPYEHPEHFATGGKQKWMKK